MSPRAEVLHASPWCGVLYVTGGGSLLLSELLTAPGASATVLEARVPYAEAALAELLGRRPEQACSDATARAMAMAAFQRARQLSGRDPGVPTFGLACTASLATSRRKRGQHRAHAAVQTATGTCSASLTFAADREQEERELAELLWHTLATALELDLSAAPPADPLVTRTTAQQHWRRLILEEEVAYPTAPHDGRLLMPGAFNPLHHGHERMLAIAEAKTGLAGAFELSIVNVDKPFLDYTEIDNRLRQFSRPVWVTRLPTFLDKARRFPGACFTVGIDTLTRIADTGYYGSDHRRDQALGELDALAIRFVVFGRRLESGFLTLAEVDVPEVLRALCIEVSREEFDEPVSSTALRGGRRPR